ncbi:MAG: hypothetical protein AB1589_17420 [Cyanobacteriota bacterium]
MNYRSWASVLKVGNREQGTGNGEWGMGNGEWGMGKAIFIAMLVIAFIKESLASF